MNLLSCQRVLVRSQTKVLDTRVEWFFLLWRDDETLIGMTGRRWPASALASNVPKAMYTQVRSTFHGLSASVAAAGGLPVELTRDADVEASSLRLDGLILSGERT